MQSKIELYGEVREAIRLGEYTTWTEMRFCKVMADVYGCIPLQSDGDNLNSFLSVLYHYGVVQGIRQARARKRKQQKMSHEVAQIAWELEKKPLLYQVMKAAMELNTVEPLRQAVNLLKGAKRMKEIDDIKIFPCFEEHPPKTEKMEQKRAYFRETGLLQSQIILDSENNLIDGYTSYLLARENDMEYVPIRYGKRQIVRAYHREGGKLYAWELPGLLIARVSVGDKLIVPTQRGVRVVTVAAVEEYRPEEYPEPLRTVIRRKKKVRAA